MKKPLLILFAICCIVSAFGQSIGKQVRLSASDVKIESAENGYVRVNFEGSEYMEKIGEPQLPMLTYRFVVPQEAQINGVNVQANSRVKLNLDYPIFPAQEPDILGFRAGRVSEFTINNAIYQSSQEYPGRQAEIIGDNMQSDYRIITVGIYPVTYNPASKEIFISSLSMNLNYTMPSTRQTRSLEELPKQSAIRADYAKAVIRSLVDNPESVDTFSPQVNIVRQAKNIQLVDTTNLRAPRVVNLLQELIPEYIIITNEALKESFQPLADWKTQLGKPAIIKTVEDIYKSYPGIDKPEQIRNYLIECKKRWGAELFVLLGGNNDIVPAREVSGTQSKYWVTDLYYATTGSTWYDTYNNNRGFQASENGHDFNVGRAPAGTPEDVVNFISKVIAYEKGLFTDKSYVNNFLTALGILDRAKCIDPATNQPYPIDQQIRQSLRHEGYYNDVNDDLNNYLPARVKSRSKLMIDNHQLTGTVYTYDTKIKRCTFLKENSTRQAHEPSNANGLLGDFELSRQNFLDQLNTGGYHIIFHCDHSAVKAIGTSSADKSSSTSSTDAAGLTNGKDKLQIMFSTGCDPATFSAPDCFGAGYVNARNGGGVAFIGNSDVGIYGDEDRIPLFLDKMYHKTERNDLAFLYKNLFDKNIAGKRRLTLLGDPAMQVWSDIPQPIAATVGIRTVEKGKIVLELDITDTIPAGGFKVCISKGTDYYYTDVITQQGMNVFEVDNFTSNDITVTITGRNYMPYINTIPDIYTNVPPVITGVEYSHIYQPEGIKEKDRKIIAGETVGIRLNVRKNGAIPNNLVKARLSINGSSDDVVILNDEVSFSSTNNPNSSFLVQFKNSMSFPDGLTQRLKNDLNPISFKVDIYTNDDQYTTEDLKVDVYKPRLEVTQKNVVLYGQKRIQYEVRNTGMGMASSVNLSIINRSNNESKYHLGDLAPGEIKEITPGSITTPFIVGGTPLESYTLKIEDLYGHGIQKTFKTGNEPKKAVSSCAFVTNTNEIALKWNTVYDTDLAGYNIYRADTPNGVFKKINKSVNPHICFTDYGVKPTTKYYYAIAVVNKEGWEGPLSATFEANTSFRNKGLFPVKMNINVTRPSVVPVSFYDFNGDGKHEIFTGLSSVQDGKTTGYVFGFKSDGTELINLDGNTTTYSGFFNFDAEIWAGVSLGRLSSYLLPQAITLKRWNHSGTQQLLGFVNESFDHIGKPDIKFNNKSNVAGSIYSYAPVLTSFETTSGNANTVLSDIITVSWDMQLTVFNADGTLKWTKQVPKTSDYAQSKIAVGNIDGTDNKYIVTGTNNGVFLIDKNGRKPFFLKDPVGPIIRPGINLTDLPVGPPTGLPDNSNILPPTVVTELYPIFQKTGYDFMFSSPVLADIDGDGINEIIIRGSHPDYFGILDKVNVRYTTIFVMDQSGKLKPGWGTNLTPAHDWDAVGLAVADIYGDGNMYVIEQGHNQINIYDADGNMVVNHQINDLNFRQVPLIADMDGDNEAEVIAFAKDKVVSFKMDGSVTPGFPIQITSVDAGTVSLGVCDLDGTGYSDLVAALGTEIYVWETPGRADRIEWGMQRKDAQHTGQYKPKAQTKSVPKSYSAVDSKSFNKDNCKLYQNTPNPVTSSTQIRYYVPYDNCQIAINIYNLYSGLVKSYNGLPNNDGSITIDEGALPPGFYIYGLTVNGDMIDAKKMVIR